MGLSGIQIAEYNMRCNRWWSGADLSGGARDILLKRGDFLFRAEEKKEAGGWEMGSFLQGRRNFREKLV